MDLHCNYCNDYVSEDYMITCGRCGTDIDSLCMAEHLRTSGIISEDQGHHWEEILQNSGEIHQLPDMMQFLGMVPGNIQFKHEFCPYCNGHHPTKELMLQVLMKMYGYEEKELKKYVSELNDSDAINWSNSKTIISIDQDKHDKAGTDYANVFKMQRKVIEDQKKYIKYLKGKAEDFQKRASDAEYKAFGKGFLMASYGPEEASKMIEAEEKRKKRLANEDFS